MSVHLEIVNHDELYRSLTNNPIIVNDFDLSSQAQLDKLNEKIYTTYKDDSLEILPTCDCQNLKGEYKVNMKCDICGSLCLPITEKPFESAMWIRAPKGIDALINPEIWIILSKRFTERGVNVLEWLTNPTMTIAGEKPLQIKKLENLGIQRGLNYFYRNFDKIIDVLINGKVIKKSTLREREELLVFLAENRDSIFTQRTPIPSRLAFITEKTPLGTYADPVMTPAVEAVRTITSIENSITELSIKNKESRTVKAIMQLSEYYETFYGKPLSPKSGWFRKHIYGSRVHFSFRAVITSLSDVHEYDEVHLPWSMSVMFLKLHLISKLLKRGFSPNDALKHLHEHTLKYDSLIDELFKELISEAPEGSLSIILQRNPSLTRGSAQNLKVTKIKTDPDINTISLSVLVLASLNADFDGDQLNGMLIHDIKTMKRVSRLKPHLYALDLNNPRSLSGFMSLPSPVVANIAAWVHADQ